MLTMASPSGSPIQRLPDELLLHIASQLPDSGTPKHLKSLCLVSRRFYPAAQEALHSVAKLAVACGCHPEVNGVVKLLRTIFDRPDLAAKIRSLRFRTVRKNIAKVYEDQGFDLPAIRQQCLSKIATLGYGKKHPWWRSLENSIESAFAGVLLVQIPYLATLDFWVSTDSMRPLHSVNDK